LGSGGPVFAIQNSAHYTHEPRSQERKRRNEERPDLQIDCTNQTYYIDVSVIDPSAKSFCLAASHNGGAAALTREKTKSAKYVSWVKKYHPGAEFVPFVLETYGTFGAQCSTIITALAREAERNTDITQTAFRKYAYRKLSVDLQYGNATVAFDGVRKVRNNTSRHNVSNVASVRVGAGSRRSA